MSGAVRYAQGGGLTDAERVARERIRLEAVVRFEGGKKNGEIAAALRVSERSVERWRRQWRERGAGGVKSKGSPGRPNSASVSRGAIPTAGRHGARCGDAFSRSSVFT